MKQHSFSASLALDDGSADRRQRPPQSSQGRVLPVQTDSAIMNSKKALMTGFMVLVSFMSNAAAGAEPRAILHVLPIVQI